MDEKLLKLIDALNGITSDLYDELVNIGHNLQTDRQIKYPKHSSQEQREQMLSDRINKSAGASILTQISVLEDKADVLFPPKNDDSPIMYWLKSSYLDKDDKLKLSSYYHIRNSRGHKSRNKRGDAFQNEFEISLERDLLQGVRLSDDNKIILDQHAASVCNQFLNSIARKQLEGVCTDWKNFTTGKTNP